MQRMHMNQAMNSLNLQERTSLKGTKQVSDKSDFKSEPKGRQLIVADGSCPQIRQLLTGALDEAVLIEGASNPLVSITEELQQRRRSGNPVRTLHIIAHGKPGGIQIGGHWVNTESLITNAQLLDYWETKEIVVWSCETGSDMGFALALEGLTRSRVYTSKERIRRSSTNVSSRDGYHSALNRIISEGTLSQVDFALTAPLEGIYSAYDQGAPGASRFQLINASYAGNVATIGSRSTTPDLWGLTFDSDGELYGSNGYDLYSVNKTTYAATLIGGNYGSPPSMYAIDISPSGILYGVSFQNNAMLYRINKSTGQRTSINTSSASYISDIAFSPEGVLYGLSYLTGNLFTFSLSTGVATDLGTITGLSIGNFGLMFDQQGTLWVTSYSGSTKYLYSVNLDTLTSTGSYALNGLSGGVLNGGDIYLAPPAPAPTAPENASFAQIPVGYFSEATTSGYNLSGNIQSSAGTVTVETGAAAGTGGSTQANGKYGTFNFWQGSNFFTYTPDQSKIQPLKSGELVTDTFDLLLTASNGTTATGTYTVTIEGDGSDPTPEKSITITGSRGTVSGKPGIVVDGITGGFEAGDAVIPYIRFPGQTSFSAGSARPTVGSDGDFSWSRKTGKRTTVYFTNEEGDVKSNRVTIPAAGSGSLQRQSLDSIISGGEISSRKGSSGALKLKAANGNSQSSSERGRASLEMITPFGTSAPSSYINDFRDGSLVTAAASNTL